MRLLEGYHVAYKLSPEHHLSRLKAETVSSPVSRGGEPLENWENKPLERNRADRSWLLRKGIYHLEKTLMTTVCS